VLAYNDTYLLTAALAFITLIWVLYRLTRLRYINWRQTKMNAAQPVTPTENS
jgi:hypothetical protein